MLLRQGRIPDFFAVGAPYTGAELILDALRNHHDTFVLAESPHFFSEIHGPVTPESLGNYRRLSSTAHRDALVGDISLTYLHAASACENLARFAPNGKILIFLRNPVLRSASHYMHMRTDERAPTYQSFDEAFDEAATAVRRGLEIPWGAGFRKSFYADGVRRYVAAFDSSVLVVLEDDIQRSPVDTWSRVLGFLGIGDTLRGTQSMIRTRIRHLGKRLLGGKNGSTEVVPSLPKDDIRRYATLFERDIIATGDIIGRDLRPWIGGESVDRW